MKFRETSCPLSIHGLPPLFPTLSPRLDSYLPSQQLPTLLPLLHGLVSLHATATAQQVLLILLYVLVNAYFVYDFLSFWSAFISEQDFHQVFRVWLVV